MQPKEPHDQSIRAVAKIATIATFRIVSSRLKARWRYHKLKHRVQGGGGSFNVNRTTTSVPPDSPPDPDAEQKHDTAPKNRNPYVRSMRLELERKDGRHEERSVQVLCDTGCSKNVLSKKMAEMYNLGLEPGEKRLVLVTLGNKEWYSIGKVKGRFRLRKDDYTWIDAEFEVSEHNERYEVILGCEALAEYDRVHKDTEVPVALAGFRPAPKSYSEKEIKQSESDQQKRQEENEARKKEARKRASEATTTTSSSTQ